MSIYCAQRVAGRKGAIVGGLAFILPGLLVCLVIAAVALQDEPPAAVDAFGAGAAAAVVAVVVQAGLKLIDPRRGLVYVLAGALGAALAGPYVVAILLLAGLCRARPPQAHERVWPALIWLAVKVGALSYGGGYVIIPLMYGDAVEAHGWMSEQAFANAVAYGQITPGPVTHTVAFVGYAAAGYARRARRHRGRLRAQLRLHPARRPPLRPAADEPERARVPRRRRPGRRGRDPRRRRPAARADRRHLAVVRARGRGDRAARARPAARRAGRGRDRRASPLRSFEMGLAEELQDETAEVLSSLIRFKTVNPPGDERECLEWLAGYLEDAGLTRRAGRRGAGAAVPGRDAARGRRADARLSQPRRHRARRPARTGRADPWGAEIRDGFLYGRGTIDMKNQTAAEAVAAARLARSGAKFGGTLKVIAVPDEETGGELGAKWITENAPRPVARSTTCSTRARAR